MESATGEDTIVYPEMSESEGDWATTGAAAFSTEGEEVELSATDAWTLLRSGASTAARGGFGVLCGFHWPEA